MPRQPSPRTPSARRAAAVRDVAVALAVTLGGTAACSGAATAGRTGSAASTSTATTSSTTTGAASRGVTPTTDPLVERESAAQDLLRRRADAIRARDRVAFAALLDDPTAPFGVRQLAAYDAIRRLPVADLTYGTVQPEPALAPDRAAAVGPGAWVAGVRGSYTLRGYDTGPRTFQVSLTLVHRADGWRFADDTDGSTQPQPWDLPDLAVARSATSLVVGPGPASRLSAYLAMADRAVAAVSGVWRAPWPRRLVVVVPGTVEQMREQLTDPTGDVSQVAAVTDGPTPDRAVAPADRVVVNPEAFARLRAAGRQVVLSHEATHVAVRATIPGRVPMWLSEGLADDVGYAAAPLSDRAVAEALVDRVRSSGLPRALPVDADFDPARGTIAPAYNEAWLAVRLLARRLGPARLVTFYETAASSGTDADVAAATARAFAAVGLDPASFTRLWRAEVERVAGS